MRLEIRRHSANSPWTYAQLDQRQREIAAGLALPGGEGALLLSEVAPVITLGRRTPETDYANTPLTTLPVSRGGLATYHGPGQWVFFAVDRLERLTGDRRGVRKAVESLLELGLELCREHKPHAELRSGTECGVWSERGKLASVGVHIERGVLQHGLAVNVFRTPESFRGIRLCGLDAEPDFLVDGPANFDEIGGRLARLACQRFDVIPTNT